MQISATSTHKSALLKSLRLFTFEHIEPGNVDSIFETDLLLEADTNWRPVSGRGHMRECRKQHHDGRVRNVVMAVRNKVRR
jgi:hypothetical protein